MKFYAKDGTELSKETFIKSYNDSYYLGNNRALKRVTQNSKYVEKEIDQLLNNGIQTPLDVIHILSWKIGKIKHKDSDNENRFVYAKGWEDAENFKIKLYNNTLDVKEFVLYIIENIPELEKLSENDPQEVLNLLKKHSPKGIGTVYLVTLLYFISKGKYPIYDRFAMMSLDAILGDIKPYSQKIKAPVLPDKRNSKFEHVMDSYYKEYVEKINKIFRDEYWENRDIDRALWVYGHAFSK